MNKFYLVTVEGQVFGTFERYAGEDLKEARLVYAKIKEKFKDVPCTVFLIKVTCEEGFEEDKTIIHKKQLNKENDFRYIIHNIYNEIIRIEELNKKYEAMAQEEYEDVQSMYHSFELLNLSILSGEEKDMILHSMEEKVVARRIAKEQKFLYTGNTINLKHAANITKKLVENIKKQDAILRSNLTSKDKVQKNNEFLKKLGINITVEELEERKIRSKDLKYDNSSMTNDCDDEALISSYIDADKFTNINSIEEQMKVVREKLNIVD